MYREFLENIDLCWMIQEEISGGETRCFGYLLASIASFLILSFDEFCSMYLIVLNMQKAKFETREEYKRTLGCIE